MEKLVNKKVRLRHRVRGTTLVACSDKESVNHIKLDDNKPKPENSVWVIKSKNPDKSVRLESVYGNSLGYTSNTTSKGLTVFQMDKSSSSSSSGDNESSNKPEWHTWWKLEDVENSGFSMVQIRVSLLSKEHVYLYPDFDTPLVKLRKGNFLLLGTFARNIFHWELEIVETPIIRKDQIIRNAEIVETPIIRKDLIIRNAEIVETPIIRNAEIVGAEIVQTPIIRNAEIVGAEIVQTPIIRKDQIIRNAKETHAPHQVQKHVGEIPSPGYTYQVNRMYVLNLYKANPGETQNPSIPFINNDVNTGRNVNESGNQIVGGAIVQTRIEKFVNNIVSRNNA